MQLLPYLSLESKYRFCEWRVNYHLKALSQTAWWSWLLLSHWSSDSKNNYMDGKRLPIRGTLHNTITWKLFGSVELLQSNQAINVYLHTDNMDLPLRWTKEMFYFLWSIFWLNSLFKRRSIKNITCSNAATTLFIIGK